MSYIKDYLKYKKKYLELKNQIAGASSEMVLLPMQSR